MNVDSNSLSSAIWEVGAARKNLALHNMRGFRGKKKMHDWVPKSECIKCIRTERRLHDAVTDLVLTMIVIGRK